MGELNQLVQIEPNRLFKGRVNANRTLYLPAPSLVGTEEVRLPSLSIVEKSNVAL